MDHVGKAAKVGAAVLVIWEKKKESMHTLHIMWIQVFARPAVVWQLLSAEEQIFLSIQMKL